MKELTKAEEQIMQKFWEYGSSFVKDVIEKFDEPKPAYNTISTIIRILERKNFVGHEVFGNTYRYYPLISKKEYTKSFMKGFVKNYFQNSVGELVSFFAEENQLSIEELESLKKIIEKKIKRR